MPPGVAIPAAFVTALGERIMSTVLSKLAFRAVASGLLMAAFAPTIQAQSGADGRITLDPDAPKVAAPASPAQDKPAVTPAPAAAPVATPATPAPEAPAGNVAKPTAPSLPVVYPASVEVTGKSVRLRSGPTEQYAVVKVLTAGDVLVGTGIEKDWVSVRMPSDAPCWVSASFVTDLGNGNGMVKGSRVNLRISPNTNHYPVGQVTDKAVRLVLDADGKPRRNGDWIQIVPPSEAKAWVHSNFVKASEAPLPAEPVTVAAKAAEAPADGANAGAPAPVLEITPEDAARERARRLVDEAKAFRELDKLFLEEIAKPQDQRNFAEMKLLYGQYSESAEDKDVRARAVERVTMIEQTEAKIASMVAEAQKRAEEAKAAAEKSEQERIARLEALRKAANENATASVTWLSTGYIADHGKDAKVPASHALCDGDGNVLYYVRWDTGDLNGLWQKRVRIAGTATEHTGWDKPVVVITSVEEVKD